MRQVRFASTVAAALALLASTSSAAVISEDIGAVSLLIGSTASGNTLNVAGDSVRIQAPRQINYDSQGNLYMAEFGSQRITRVDGSTGIATSVTGHTNVIGVLVDPNDDTKLYVSTWATSATIQSFNVASPGSKTTVTSGHNKIHMIDYDVASDVLYFPARDNSRVRSVPKDGGSYTDVATYSLPVTASVVQGAGHLFGSGGERVVRQIALDGSSNVIVAGAASVQGDDDGAGSVARFTTVRYSTMSRDMKYLFLGDPSKNNVRRMDAATYVVNTVFNPSQATAGSYAASYPDSLSARLNTIQSPAFNYAGDTLAVSGDFGVMTIAYTGTPAPPTTTAAPTPPPTPACNCATTTNLEVDYSSNDIPDATGSAIVDIYLDKTVWEVKFVVSGVKSINNGHVIPHSVDTQQLSAVDAFSPNTAAFVQADLWSPPQCSLGPVDTASTDAASGAEGVVVGFNPASCEKNYTMSYSLISPSLQDMKHCELNVNGAVITVNCSVTLSTVRAYDLTEPLSYTAQETAFAASIDLRNDLTFTETNLLHATLAKCSVKNGPLYVVDCRVPGEWVFDQSAFSLVQEPAGWIDASSCASNVVGTGDTAASYIRCDIVNNAPIADVQTARANLTAHRVGAAAGDDLTFDVEYIIPRKVTTSASASLASFVTSIAMADGLFYYGTADKAVLEIGVVDSARLSMTALELFNDATPRVVYDIFPGTSDARFQTALNAVTDKFTIEFYPAAIREDSEFYRYGPHGINVSFTFSAARRSGANGGWVQVGNLNVEGTEATSSSGAQGSAASSSSGTALMAGVAVGAAVLVAGLVGAAVVAVKRRGGAAAEEGKAEL